MKRSMEWTDERRLFRELAEATSLLAWITEPDGYCSHLSSAWYSFTGMVAGEAEGFGWLDAIHPEDRVRARRAFFDANDQGAEYHVAYRLRREDGSYLLTWAHGMSRYRDSHFAGYLGITKSVEHYELETELTADGTGQRHLLTEREREVIALIAQGNTTETVAAMLSIAPRTVESHAANAALKLGASNRVHLVAKAIKLNEI